MKCKWCDEEQHRCYFHCHESKDGKHEHDPQSFRRAEGCNTIVDVTCHFCGHSGSCAINPKNIQWD